jgi:SAM-dependent methyltransferase
MKFRKNANSRPHNWLIHHYQIVDIEKYVHQYIKGYVLDVGCGIKPYREIIEKTSTMYIGLEYSDTLHGLSQVDVIGSAVELPFADETFDSIVSFQVMEHVSEPVKFLSEIRRVLKKKGYALITTPFMWMEHEQPRDFFRYTRYGLQHIAEKAGFKAVAVNPATGYWSTSILHFNYWLNRFLSKPLSWLFRIVWLDQYFAYWLDRIDHRYTIDTATFTTVLKKED